MSSPSSDSSTRSVIEDVFNAFSNHDLDRFADLLAADAVLHDPSTGARHEGPEAICNAISVIAEAIPDLNPTVTNLLIDGEQGCAEVVRTGTHTGPLHFPDGTTVPPTGREVELPECIVFRVQDGAVTHMTTYVDRALVMAQLGLDGA